MNLESSPPLSEYPKALCGHFHFWNWGHTHNLPVSHTPTTSPCLTHPHEWMAPRKKEKENSFEYWKKYECDLACKMVADKDWMVSNHISTEPCVFFFVVTVVPCLTTIHVFLSGLTQFYFLITWWWHLGGGGSAEIPRDLLLIVYDKSDTGSVWCGVCLALIIEHNIVLRSFPLVFLYVYMFVNMVQMKWIGQRNPHERKGLELMGTELKPFPHSMEVGFSPALLLKVYYAKAKAIHSFWPF